MRGGLRARSAFATLSVFLATPAIAGDTCVDYLDTFRWRAHVPESVPISHLHSQGSFVFGPGHNGRFEVWEAVDDTLVYWTGRTLGLSWWDVAADAQFAYLAGRSGSVGEVTILDYLVTPIPDVVGTLPLLGEPERLVRRGGVLFLAVGVDGLAVVSVADPRQPIELASMGGLGDALALADGGRYIHIADGDGWLRVVDALFPGGPSPRGAVPLPGVPAEIVLNGSYAYVGTEEDVHVVDVSDPVAPALVRTLDLLEVDALHVVDDRLVVGGGLARGIDVFDLSVPDDPQRVGHSRPPTGAGSLTSVGDRLYSGGNPIHVHDLSRMGWHEPVARHTIFGHALDMRLSGGLTYVANDSSLEVFDLSDVTNPIPVGSTTQSLVGTFTTVSSVDVRGDLAVIGESFTTPFGKLHTVDVSDPATPVVVGAELMTGGFDSVVLLDEYAFVGGDDLRRIDVSDVENPFYAGVAYAGGCQDLTLDGDRLRATTSSSVTIWDVADPTAVVALGVIDVSVPVPAPVYGYAFWSGYAAVLTDDELLVYLVTDLADPQLLARLAMPFLPGSIAVVDGILYLVSAGTSAAVYVVNVDVPSAPWVMGTMAVDVPGTGGPSSFLTPAPDVVYLARTTDLVVVPRQCRSVGVNAGSSVPSPTRAYPNPFSARVAVSVEEALQPDAVMLVFDARGRLVRRVQRDPGPRAGASFRWDGRTLTGSSVAPGTYFYHIEGAGRGRAGKIVRTR